jgi:hypothetical protein
MIVGTSGYDYRAAPPSGTTKETLFDWSSSSTVKICSKASGCGGATISGGATLVTR